MRPRNAFTDDLFGAHAALFGGREEKRQIRQTQLVRESVRSTQPLQMSFKATPPLRTRLARLFTVGGASQEVTK